MSQDLKQRLTKAQETLSTLQTEKIRKEEQLRSEQKRLNEIVAEIKELGYDPKTLPETIEAKKKEIADKLDTFEKEAEQVQAQLTQLSTV